MVVIYQQWLVNFSGAEYTLVSISIGSAAFLVVQVLSFVTLLVATRNYKSILHVFLGTLFTWGFISVLSYGHWLTPSVFTNDFIRLLPGLFLLMIVSLFAKNEITLEALGSNFGPLKNVCIAFIISFTFLLSYSLVFRQPINAIVFDEHHGSWETTKTPYGPDDFGRNITYTYTLLYQYAEKLSNNVTRYEGGKLPQDTSTLFILKMPIEPLSDKFSEDMVDWVERGGHLLVVADHTNLFDTTTNLTPILKRLGGVELASNANFNKKGNPTTVSEGKLEFLLGKLLGVMSPFPYMTGTGFRHLPISALTIGNYGQSFVEEAIYFRPNRFGYFNPNLDFAFGNHPSAIVLAKKRGMVTVIGDSTPWSNFAIFHGEYFDLFRNIVSLNSYSYTFKFFYILLVGLAISFLFIVVFSGSIFRVIGAVFCGAYIGTTALIGSVGISDPKIGRDYSLNASLGSGAKAENLIQLVPIGEQNFTRALSTFPKYGVTPRLALENTAPFNPNVPINLLINPSSEALPNLTEIIKYIQGGGRINILFDKSQVKDRGISEWLKSLSMKPEVIKSLAIQEGGYNTIENRFGIDVTKVIGFRVGVLPTSHFIEVGSQDFFQSFRLQGELSLGGHLIIGFNSEAISDAVIGEVWEGTIPSILSKVREKQIAMLASSVFPKQLLVIDDQRKVFQKELNVPLKKFIIVKDGLKLMSGDINLAAEKGSIDSLGDDPDFYLGKLEHDAIMFINKNCKELDENRFCKNHFISHDLIEWTVTYAKLENKITALELVHDRRFSGLKANYNIVFLSK